MYVEDLIRRSIDEIHDNSRTDIVIKFATRCIIVYQKELNSKLYFGKGHFEMFGQKIAHAHIWRKDIDGFIAENVYFLS